MGTVAALVAAVVLAAAFFITERTVTAPMLPLSLLSPRARRGAGGAMVLRGAITASYVYITSLYIQRVERFSPSQWAIQDSNLGPLPYQR